VNGNRIFLSQGETKVTKVNLRSNETQDQLFRRFRTKVTRAGVLGDLRRKRWFVSKSEERRLAKKKAVRRSQRNQRMTDNG
jgi:small subunit ribosomal protein S21